MKSVPFGDRPYTIPHEDWTQGKEVEKEGGKEVQRRGRGEGRREREGGKEVEVTVEEGEGRR